MIVISSVTRNSVTVDLVNEQRRKFLASDESKDFVNINRGGDKIRR